MMTPRDHYESESFNYNGTTTKTPPETPTSNNTDSPSRSGVMSPMPGPMAFTIDFGSSNEVDSEAKKKLSLRDGIRMFAPNKKKSPAPSSSQSGHASLSPRPVASCSEYEKKKESDVGPIFAPPRETTVKIASSRVSSDPETLPKTIPEASSLKVRSVRANVGVDADNNITLSNDNRDNRNSGRGGDAASEAGTYTIDQEEDADGEEDQEEDFSAVSKASIGEKFSVREDQWSTRDWVDRWASSSLPTTIVGTDPDDDYEDDFEDDEEQQSFLSVRDSEGSKSSRRRLPPTPMRGTETVTTTSSATTEDCLKETISVMAAMEARLSSKTREREAAAVKNITLKTSQTVDPTRKQSSAKKPVTSSPSAGASANKAADRLAAWQRRKNYDPMKAATNGKINHNSARGHQSPSQSMTEESYSGSCSDLDLQNDRVGPSRGSHFMVHGPVNNVSSNKQTPDHKVLNSAKPNRAFGLRQANSMISSTHSNVERTNSKGDFARSESNKYSSLTTSRAAKSQSGPYLSAATTQKKMAPGIAAAVKSGRSTSSLSSKEAEYQAWKRRKNYNPLRSAAAANGAAKKESQRPLSSNTPRSANATNTTQNASGSSVRRITSVVEAEVEDNIHRSASFHYPDGFSRVQHNVFTSEDEDCDSGMVQPRLYEVNDDELVLTIGRVPSLENGVYHPNRKPGMRSSPSRGSPSRLETLDNLVISTIFSVSTKLCLTSGKLIRRLQENTTDKEQLTYLDTLLYVLEDVEPEVSPSKKTSRELAGTLRNLKKIEQALQTLDRLSEQDM